MQRQTVCALTDWLNGVTSKLGFSVNELLLAAPASSRDPLDAAVPKAVALIADPYRTDKVRDFTVQPSKLPAIYVVPDGPVTMDGVAGPVDRKARAVAVACRVIVQNPDAAASQRYADYVQRAIEQSLDAFLEDSDEGHAARSREGMLICEANAIVAGPWQEAVGDATAVAVTAVDFQCREQRPRG
jgi:hypothetical protein